MPPSGQLGHGTQTIGKRASASGATEPIRQATRRQISTRFGQSINNLRMSPSGQLTEIGPLRLNVRYHSSPHKSGSSVFGPVTVGQLCASYPPSSAPSSFPEKQTCSGGMMAEFDPKRTRQVAVRPRCASPRSIHLSILYSRKRTSPDYSWNAHLSWAGTAGGSRWRHADVLLEHAGKILRQWKPLSMPIGSDRVRRCGSGVSQQRLMRMRCR